jgi:hypothetical protein
VSAKTYGRETGAAIAAFNAGIILWGLYTARPDIIDMGKFLVPFTVAGLTAAIGAKAALVAKVTK